MLSYKFLLKTPSSFIIIMLIIMLSIMLIIMFITFKGHLALNNERNTERLGREGVCQNAVSIMQVHVMNPLVCTEACWALRNLAIFEANR